MEIHPIASNSSQTNLALLGQGMSSLSRARDRSSGVAALWSLRWGMLSRMLSSSVHLVWAYAAEENKSKVPSVVHNTLKTCRLIYCSQAHSGSVSDCPPLPGLALSFLSADIAEVPPLPFGYTVDISGLAGQQDPFHTLFGVPASLVRTSCPYEWAAKPLCPHFQPTAEIGSKGVPHG